MNKNCNYILFIIIFIMILSCSRSDKSVINASIFQFGGTVTVGGKLLSEPGYSVKYNDLISTGEKSFCDIKINKRNILKLGEKTDFRFKISGDKNIIQLERGWMGGVTKEKFTKQGKFLIKTPTAIAAVRGTYFCFKVEDKDNSYFCVCNGKIEFIESGRTSGETVESAHHAAMRFTKKPDGSIEINKNPGLLYHNDEGVEKLAKLVNASVDWRKPDSE